MSRILTALVVGVALGTAVPVCAQGGSDLRDRKVSIALDEMDVRDALKAFFQPLEVSYAVDPEVQGTVTAVLREIPFETALRSILIQVDAVYTVEQGVFHIVRKPEAPPAMTLDDVSAPGEPKRVIRRISIRNADPALIIALLSGNLNPLQNPVSSSIGQEAGFAWGLGGGRGGSMGLGFGGGSFGGRRGF